MQRTYRSKKETGGGLDPREVLFSLDDQSSAFDAFYIQNIKQTKREFSCTGNTNHNKVVTNRVRKRKYVRKIVREVEPVVDESMSKSTYLTPDKSLHVNKGIDLFDKLLQGSPEPLKPHETENNMFDQLRLGTEHITYGCKEIVKPRGKKFNYSSSDTSDNEKENMTDLGKHELIIEKVTKTSPITPEDSINQIVNNISSINNIIKRKTYRKSIRKSSSKSLTDNLTNNIGNSPLCSTPLVEKYRGKSIYKFSPIAMGALDDSDKISDEKKNTISHVEDGLDKCRKDVTHLFEREDDKTLQSPVLTSKSCLFGNSSRSFRRKQIAAKYSPKGVVKKEVMECEKKIHEEQVNGGSLCQDSAESIPLIGFTNTSFNAFNEGDENDRDQEKSILLPSRKRLVLKCNGSNPSKKTPNSITRELSQKVHVSDDIFADDQISSEKNETVETSAELEPFLGFTETALQNNYEVIKIDQSEASVDSSEAEITMVDVISNIDTSITDLRENLSSSKENSENETGNESKSEDDLIRSGTKESSSTSNGNCAYEAISPNNNVSKINSQDSDSDIESDSQNTKYSEDFNSIHNYSDNDNIDYADTNSDRQSLYDTCNSIDSGNEPSQGKINDFKHIQPVVVLDRMNESTFKKYNCKLSHPNSSGTNSCNSSIQHELSICDDDQNTFIEEINHLKLSEDLNSEGTEQINHLKTSHDLNSESTDSRSCEEEVEKQISFVTTRRRQEIRNESLMIILDDSDNSIDSSEENKTVLSNHDVERRLNESDLDDLDLNVNNISFTMQEKSVTLIRESRHNVRERIQVDPILDVTEVKAPIVLQPGKKWERSLSIYRRMTMQSDLEQSMAEGGDSMRKGRKYRESVIHTMELQDRTGPLHNESLSSYRSSFISKPHRTTIRLAKEPNVSRISLCTSTVFDDLTGFLHEDCDDTVIELSKLSIGDAHEITVVENHDSTVRGTTARDFVLGLCKQSALVAFDECYPDSALKNCHKIGEGVYGEVFLWRARDGRARVLKVVPIAGHVKVNGEHQKDFHEIISEIVIAMELSALRAPIPDIESHFDEGKDADTLDLHTIENATDGFNEVIAVRCVQGGYPSRLLDLWELYDESKGSENDNPAGLPVDQQYIVLELANAGQDLEGYQFNNAEQSHALFLQVAFTLAVGEESFQFEHRDLHWGNVLIAPTEQKYATFVLRGRAHRVPRRGVCATVIDYTLSRLSLPLTGERAALFNDLATDDGLFDAVGDYQFEVYRLMRDKLGNNWKNYEPYTNILWLHYTVDKMITSLRYKRTNTKLHKHFIAKLKGIKNRILNYRSAVEFVLTDNEF